MGSLWSKQEPESLTKYFKQTCFLRVFMIPTTLTQGEITNAIESITKRNDYSFLLANMYSTRTKHNQITIHAKGHKSSIFKDPKQLTIKRQIGSGASGKIVLSSYKRDDAETNVVIKFGATTDTNALLDEAFNHCVLQCTMHCIMNFIRPLIGAEFEYPIPTLYGVARIDDSVCLLMSEMKMSLSEFLLQSDYTGLQHDIFDVFIQIFYKLYYMQVGASFLHGDFHMGNIMIQERRSVRPMAYVINSLTDDTNQTEPMVFKTISRYRVFFIDMGGACVSPYICQGSDSIFESRFGAYERKTGEGRCQNTSFDVLLLMTHISLLYTKTKINMQEENPIMVLLKHFRKKIFSTLLKPKTLHWHNAYAHYLKYDHDFNPRVILSWLNEHQLHHANYKRSRGPAPPVPPPNYSRYHKPTYAQGRGNIRDRDRDERAEDRTGKEFRERGSNWKGVRDTERDKIDRGLKPADVIPTALQLKDIPECNRCVDVIWRPIIDKQRFISNIEDFTTAQMIRKLYKLASLEMHPDKASQHADTNQLDKKLDAYKEVVRCQGLLLSDTCLLPEKTQKQAKKLDNNSLRTPTRAPEASSSTPSKPHRSSYDYSRMKISKTPAYNEFQSPVAMDDASPMQMDSNAGEDYQNMDMNSG